VLNNYEPLRSDPKKYEEILKKIDDKAAPLLGEIRRVQQEIVALTKEQDQPRENMEQAKREAKTDVRSFKQKIFFCFGKQKNIENPTIESLTQELKLLRWAVQEACFTPLDKVCSRQYYQAIIYGPMKGYFEEAFESSDRLRVKTAQLLTKVGKIQGLVNLDLGCSPESRKKVEKLVKDIQELHKKIDNTNEDYNDFKNLVIELKEVGKKLDAYIIDPNSYNPYYLIDRVLRKESVDIDKTLPGSCGIKTTRRGLSKLGIDTTKEEVADRFVYKDALSWESQGAFQHYGFEYTYVTDCKTSTTIGNPIIKVVTIEDIDHITKQGHVVEAGVSKPGIGAHYLLIEGVTKTENGYLVTFYDPNPDELVTLPYKELEKVLMGHYTIPSEEQMKTREPILKREQMHQIQESAEDNKNNS
jgi:hypothetical protein